VTSANDMGLQNFPEDFDGIIACAPGLNFVNLLGWLGLTAQPFYTGKPGAMLTEDWNLVHSETMAQCDALDGLVDQTIAYPDNCKFNAAALLCSATRPAPCLNADQVAGVQKMYTDRYEDGKLLYPRFNLGAETSGPSFGVIWGNLFPLPPVTMVCSRLFSPGSTETDRLPCSKCSNTLFTAIPRGTVPTLV